MVVMNKRFNFCGIKKNNSIKFFSTNEISKNLSENSFDFTWANAPVLIGVVLLGAVVGAGIGYIFNTYVFKKPGVEPTTGVGLNKKPDSVEPTTEVNVDSKKLTDFPGFTDNDFCIFESHKASIDGIPLINQRSFINKFYSWIERSNLTEDPNWVEFSQLLHRVYLKSLIFEKERDLNDHIILDLEAKFGLFFDYFNKIHPVELTQADKIRVIKEWLEILLADADILFTLDDLTKNSMPMCFTLPYFVFLIYNISKKYLIFHWIKSNFLLKFYTFRVFFKL